MENLIILGGNVVSGAELVLIDYLKNSSLKFTVITSKEIEKTGYFNLENVKTITCNGLEMIGASRSFHKKIKKIINLFTVTKRIRKALRENKVKRIITNNTGDVLYLSFLEKKEIKIFSYIHDILSPEQLQSKIILKNKNKIDKFITVSDASKKALESIGIETKSIIKIYNGMIPKEYVEKNILSKQLLFIGILDERKNPLEFLEFLKILKKYKYIGKIIYKYSDKKIIKQMDEIIKKENLKIQFFKNLNKNEIEEIFKETDYLFISSKRDPLPTVVLEALNNSIPVIGHRIDGIPEMVTDRINGFLYSDKEELQKIAMEIVETDLKKYKELSLNANNTIKNKFDNKNKISILEQLFSDSKCDI